jgi:serine/threonine protein kinase
MDSNPTSTIITTIPQTNFTIGYSKCKILKQIKHEYVTFATVKLTNIIESKNKKKTKTSSLQDVVIKSYPNTKLGSKELLNEVAILEHINNNINDPNLKVPKSLYYKVNKKRPHDHFIERIEGHDLEYWVTNVFAFENYEPLATTIMTKVAKAIQVLHNNKIVHRDIKPENILLNFADNSTNVIMIDFAFSKIIRDECLLTSTSYCGTEQYVSPELLKQEPYNLLANDVWSFGATFFALLSGHYLPLCQNENQEEYFKMCKLLVCELHVKDIIKKVFCKIFISEDKRITINEVVTMLSNQS